MYFQQQNHTLNFGATGASNALGFWHNLVFHMQ
jgi:hypothetical protein